MKRYEHKLGVYFLYNLQTCEFWKTDFHTGTVVSLLDGNYTRTEVIDLLFENNSKITKEQLEKHFYPTFDFLLEKGFISVQS